MRGPLYDVLRKKIRNQRIIYSIILVAMCAITFASFFRSDGHIMLAMKALYLKRHNKFLESENKQLQKDINELMPPCMISSEFTITAYEKSARSCQKWAKYGRTFSNTVPAKFRTAAVDPSIIKEGSLIYAKGIGWLIAEDRGGAIKGNRIDIYLNSVAEAMDFGKKKVKVYYQNSQCFQRLLATNRFSEVISENYLYE